MDRIDVYFGWHGRDVLVRQALGAAPEQLAQRAGGKPYLPGGPEFNISHSGALTVCAVGRSPIGVDVEQMRPRRLAALRRVLHPDELAHLSKLPPEEQRVEFYRAWTIKEACCKLTGEGISLSKLAQLNSLEPPALCKSAVHSGEYMITLCAAQPAQVVFHERVETL